MDFVPDLHGEPIYLSLPQADHPPDPDDIRWAELDVVPALEELAHTLETENRLDLAPLAAAGEGLDDSDRPAWGDFVRRLGVQAARDLDLLSREPAPDGPPGNVLRFTGWSAGAAKECTLMGAVKAINDQWCVPRRLLLYRSNTSHLRDGPGLLWQRVAVNVAALHTAAAIRFAGGEIATFLVSGYRFESGGGGGIFDPFTQSAVLHLPCFVHEAIESELVAQGNPAFVQYRQIENPVFATGTAYVQYGTGRWRAYRDRRRLVQAILDRVFAEEVRHGMDRHRMLVAASRAHDSDFNYVSNGLLTPQGRLRGLLQSRAGVPDEAVEFLDTWVQPGAAVIELSGQLTAAACAEPCVLLQEWWLRLAQLQELSRSSNAPVSLGTPAHLLACILGTLLLGEHLHLGCAMTEKAAFEPDSAGLAAAASQFLCRSAQELRVAIKAIYHANFKFPIDEPPFAEITAEGWLHGRPDWCVPLGVRGTTREPVE